MEEDDVDDELLGRRNLGSVSIPVAAEDHSSSNAPRHEMRPVTGLEFERTGEPFSQRLGPGSRVNGQ
jgi:hypothetical protein